MSIEWKAQNDAYPYILYGYDEGQTHRIKYDVVALKEVLEKEHIKVHDDDLYRYDIEQNKYVIMDDADFVRRFKPEDCEYYQQNYLKTLKKDSLLIDYRFKLETIDERGYVIVYHDDKECHYSLNDYYVINVKNAILLFDKVTGHMEKVTASYVNVSLTSYPYNYNPKAERSNYDDLYLDNIGLNGDNAENLLFEMLACTVARVNDKSMYFILGKTDSGKSTLMNVVTQMLGKDQVTRHNIKELQDETSFSCHDMLGSYCNFNDESTLKITNQDRLKEMCSGGTYMTFRRKNREERSGFFNCKLWFLSNNKLNIHNTLQDNEAFAKRVKILPLIATVPKDKQIKDIHTKLNYEYWLLRIVETLQNFIRNGYEYSFCNVANYLEQDEFSNFLDMECEVTGFQTDYVKASTLYSFYERWCEANQAPILSKQDFKKKMTHNKNFKCKQKKENGKNLGLVYLGIKLNDVDDKDILDFFE